jgi:hypothetical protein
MVSRFIVRLLCMGVLLFYSSCHDRPVSELTDLGQEVAPSTLLARARQQFERWVVDGVYINKEHRRGDLRKMPQWDCAYTVSLASGRGLVVPVYADGPQYVLAGRGKFAVNAVNYLLVYVGEDRQLCYELLAEPPVGQRAAPADRPTGNETNRS